MAEPQPEGASADLPEVVVRPQRRISVVWFIPLVAVLIGAWMVYKALSERGPTVSIRFQTAEGLVAGKTKIKYKQVEVGEVKSVVFSPDLSQVIVEAQLGREMRPYLTDTTRFWVVTARVAAGEVSGLGTLLSGAYIAMDPGRGGPSEREFRGLDKAPVVASDAPGTQFRLRSDSLGSIEVGSPVYYRRIKVGEVESYRLEDDGEDIVFDIFVNAPHDRRVRRQTRFWNASGIDVALDANGFRLNTESLVSIVIGGVAFETPNEFPDSEPAAPDSEFQLYPTREATAQLRFERKDYYLIYFDGSMRGLKVGAPVQIRGIEVGRVVDMSFEFDTENIEFDVPVKVEIEPERVKLVGGVSRENVQPLYQQLIDKGLRAQLKSGNLLTGQLLIDLDFHPDAEPVARIREVNGLKVIPTVPASIDQLRVGLQQILKRLQTLPLNEIAVNLNGTLAGANRLLNSGAMTRSLESLNRVLAQAEGFASEVNQEMLPELQRTLGRTRQTLESADGVLREDSPVYQELLAMMRELSAAARSVRDMAEYLERHPDALIRGK